MTTPPSPFPRKLPLLRRIRRIRLITGIAIGALFFCYAIGVLTGLVKIFRIPTSAMDPTAKAGDYLFSTRFKPSASDLKSGTVVVFNPEGMKPIAGIPLQGLYIKRIAALPGDTVSSDGEKLLVNGQPIERNGDHAVPPSPVPGGTLLTLPLTVPADHVFLLGDNFQNSLDSRYFGPVPISRIAYRPLCTVFPPGRAGKIR